MSQDTELLKMQVRLLCAILESINATADADGAYQELINEPTNRVG